MKKAEYDKLPKRACTRCNRRPGEIGFPECWKNGAQVSVSHDMQILEPGHPYYSSGHSIDVNGHCNMGCC